MIARWALAIGRGKPLPFFSWKLSPLHIPCTEDWRSFHQSHNQNGCFCVYINMVKIELKGKIERDYSGAYEKIKLVQEDGYKVDLVGRFQEAMESFPGMQVQVGYYLSDEPCTRQEALEGFLKKILGSIDSAEVGFEKHSWQYSSWTSGTDYITNLKIGGHDLFQELRGQEEKYILLELNFSQPK